MRGFRCRTRFGALLALDGAGVFGALVAGQRADHQVDGLAHELRLEIGMPERRDFRDEFVDDLKPDFGMGHFTAAKLEGDLDLHVLAEEIHGMHDLDAEIVRIDARAQLDLLDGGGVLVLAGFLLLLGQLIAELADFDDAADRRDGVGGNLDEIHAVLAGQVQRLIEGKNAELLALRPDDAHFAGADFAVDAHLRRVGGVALGRKRAAQATLSG